MSVANSEGTLFRLLSTPFFGPEFCGKLMCRIVKSRYIKTGSDWVGNVFSLPSLDSYETRIAVLRSS